MAWAFVQSRSTSGGGSGAKTLAYNSNVTAGSLLVLTLTTFGTDVLSVTDSQGNTWTKAMASAVNGFLNGSVWYAIAGSGAANTVTVNALGSNHGFAIHEYSGIDPTVPLGSTTTNTGTGTAVDAGSCAVPGAGSLVVAMWGQRSNFIASTAGAGWTARESQTNGSSAAANYSEDKSSSASVAGTFTSASSCNWVACAVSFAVVGDHDAEHEDGVTWGGMFTIPADNVDADYADIIAWAFAELPQTNDTVNWSGAFTVQGVDTSEQSLTDTVTFSDLFKEDPWFRDQFDWSEFGEGFGYITPDNFDSDDDSLNWAGEFGADTGQLVAGRYRR